MPHGALRRALSPLSRSLAARGIVVRAQREDDRAALRALYGAHRARELATVPWPEAAKRQFLDGQFGLQRAHFASEHRGADFLVLARTRPPLADGVIGRLYLDRRAEFWALLEIGLAPAEQGKGLGAAIVESLKGAAAVAGAAGIALHVAIDNPRAAALYRRLGFADDDCASATHRHMVWRAPAGA